MVLFSNHLGDLQVMDLLGMFWGLAKFTFLAGSDTGDWHLLVYLFVDSRASPCYVFVHEDGLGSPKMLSWPQVCGVRSVVL